jgi:hypothetical protein
MSTDDLRDLIAKNMRRAWQLGQTYWQQADSESFSQHKKADETAAKFTALIEETRNAIADDPLSPAWCASIDAELDETAAADARVVATVAGDEMSRTIIWSPEFAAFDLPVGTNLYSAAQPVEVQPVARKYISPVKTVADLTNNLLMMNQELPIYGAQYIEHPTRGRCAIAVSPTVSHERVQDSRWIGQGDVVNSAVIWTRAEQPSAEVEALKSRISGLEAELDDAEAEKDEPEIWPSWAEAVLKLIRTRTGYDGYDDQDGVDLPTELEECFLELEAFAASKSAQPVAQEPLSYVDLRRIANQCGLGANEVSARTQATVDNFARAIEAAHGIGIKPTSAEGGE